MSPSRSKNMNPIPKKNVEMNSAREYYELLQKKESAKKQQTPLSSFITPPPSTPSTKVPSAPNKNKKASHTGSSSSPGNVAQPKKNPDEAKAKAHARQYYNKLVNKEQTKKERLMQVPIPTSDKHIPTSSMSDSGKTKNVPTPLRTTSSNASRMYDKVCNDLRKLEEYEEQQEAASRATAKPYGLQTPKKSSSSTTSPHSFPKASPLMNKTFSSNNGFQRRSIVPPKIIATSTTATNSNQSIMESFMTWSMNSDLLKELFHRPLSVIDMVVFFAIFVLETKFSILSSIIPILFRYTFYGLLNTVVLIMNYGVLNTLTALLISVGTLFVLRQYTNTTSLLQLIRMNQSVKDTQIQTDVQFVLRLAYNELMLQPQVNIPLSTLQLMIFTKIFHDTTLEKKKTYWMNIIWPRVVGQMLYRHDPNIVVMSVNSTNNNIGTVNYNNNNNNMSGNGETYVRWIGSSSKTTSSSFDANHETNEILKKRKTSKI